MSSESKLKSRTFWLAVTWSVFVPLAVVAQWALGTAASIPITEIVVGASLITGAYVGGNKLVDSRKPPVPPAGTP